MKLISLYHVAFIKTIIVIYVANIFDFLLYNVALQTTAILVLRGSKEHRRMKVNHFLNLEDLPYKKS